MKDIFKSSEKRELRLLDLTFIKDVASKLLKIARIRQIQLIRRVLGKYKQRPRSGKA